MKKAIVYLLIPLAFLPNAVRSDGCYSDTSGSPPHFYVKLQKMKTSKTTCIKNARKAMEKVGFDDIVVGKHGAWAVKQGYKAQIKCSQSEKAIIFVVIGETRKSVLGFSDQLQWNFGAGFNKTRDP